jgi:hypothetical protein
MKTLLVLGAKPDPALPPASAFSALACANGSGYSAARLGLPVPAYTVMTSVLASGIGSGAQTLDAIAGLETKTLYFLRRRARKDNFIKDAIYSLKTYSKKPLHRMQPFYLKRQLRIRNFRYERFVSLRPGYYDDLVEKLCDYDPVVLGQIAKKRPSTGVVALALGIADDQYDRFVVSGFSFELTHAYANNPEIDERGTVVSAHADTDAAILEYLSRKYDNIYTTEPAVNSGSRIPMLPQF